MATTQSTIQVGKGSRVSGVLKGHHTKGRTDLYMYTNVCTPLFATFLLYVFMSVWPSGLVS